MTSMDATVPNLRVGYLLAQSWRAFKSRPWFCIGVVLVCFFTFPVMNNIVAAIVASERGITLQAAREASTPGKIMEWIGALWSIFMTAGFIYAMLKTWHGEFAPLFRSAFAGFAKFLPVLGFTLITWAATGVVAFVYGFVYLMLLKTAGAGLALIVLLLLAIPLVYAWVGLGPGLLVIMSTEMGPIDALRMSWRITSGHRGRLFFLTIVSMVVLMVGIVALLVGMFITAPLSVLLIVGAYDELVRAYVARQEAATTPAAAPA